MSHGKTRIKTRLGLLVTSALCLLGAAAHTPDTAKSGNGTTKATPDKTVPGNKSAPIGFIADKIDYDQNNNIVVARGHVQAWQDNQVITADSITFDRAANRAVARGHVAMTEPDGQVMFTDYAELSNNMRDGLFTKVSALLAHNGRLVANAGRRVDGELNEFSRAVYTSCNLCLSDPSRAPEWQIKANHVVQDLEHKRVEYSDMTLDMWGVPVAWFPYMTNADPSVKRESGFLVPSYGWNAQYMGTYVRLPYYWVIDGQSDLTVTPTLATGSGPDVDLDYRQRFNSGVMELDAMGGRDLNTMQGLMKGTGTFAINDDWRYGFSIDTATSALYLRDTNNAIPIYMESSTYLEGFGQGSWAKVSATTFQSTTTTTSQSTLPYVLPRAQYSYFNTIDPLGGRLSIDTGVINVMRPAGTNTARLNMNIDWQRAFQDPIGGVWNFRMHDDSAYYSSFSLNKTPTWSADAQAQTINSQPAAALSWRMPFLRHDSNGVGSEMIEPMFQLVASPRSGNWRSNATPNEDSLDLDFSDANLFALNRYNGIDRADGGSRVDAALHGAWYGSKNSADALFGQSFRLTNDTNEVLPGSGLGGTRSDYVAHLNFNFGSLVGISYRTRLDRNSFTPQMHDAGFAVGGSPFRLTGGYFYSTTNPYNLYDTALLPTNYFQHRNEIYLGASSHWGSWSVSGDARRDLHSSLMDSTNVHLTYDDECFTFDVSFYRRYTSLLNDSGATGVLFQITFKTIGTIGTHAS